MARDDNRDDNKDGVVQNGADTNPSAHGEDLAVALTYMPGMDQAPRVVAKGQGWLAQQIVELAEANGIEIKKDANLAEILSQVDVDSEIPIEAFTVVAEILSYIYEKNREWPDGIAPKAKK